MSDVLENETMEKRQIRIEKREAERARRKEERIKTY